jgi:hypothetical protein
MQSGHDSSMVVLLLQITICGWHYLITEREMGDAKDVVSLLHIFGKAASLSITCHNSSCVTFGREEDESTALASMLNLLRCSLPMTWIASWYYCLAVHRFSAFCWRRLGRRWLANTQNFSWRGGLIAKIHFS